ncbi:hypothetical protein E2C01_053678 [Portunus trituberculatus]|uniref:Uncharacterized protein n=1 Tax=Portunus trituberculatus TaxID=210409 RepID=A0A5B7GSX8_PORTR|nr:hypothetical protein [Portunus trituberculatus]
MRKEAGQGNGRSMDQMNDMRIILTHHRKISDSHRLRYLGARLLAALQKNKNKLSVPLLKECERGAGRILRHD